MRPALCICALSACASAEPEPRVDLEQWCAADTEQVAAQVEAWMSDMTVEDKVRQLTGNALLQNPDGLWPTPTDELRGIPGFRMVDGPRGAHRATGDATAFPVGMARGATWDPDLEERVGRAIGTEVKGKGANVLLAPTVNILRHPLWGRAQETYGEDPHHMAMMGAAFVSGAQEQVVATAKHFAVNSIEDTRFDVDVRIDERSLHEVYLPHFRHLVQQAQVGSVMSAYNHVNGRPASEQPALLRDILKGEWGFPGFVVSDWIFATETTEGSALGGLDVEMPYGEAFGDALVDAVEEGRVPMAVVDEAVTRVLRTKLCFDVQVTEPDASLVLTDAHRALAREVAARSMVLLRNQSEAVPVPETGTIVVTGRLANLPNTGDTGSSSVSSPGTITPFQGLGELAGAREVLYVPDPTDAGVQALLRDASRVVVTVGLTEEDEGEGLIAAGDRDQMGLRDEDLAVIDAVTALSDSVVVVVYGGSAITMPWADEVEAIVMGWYSGMEGGRALADLLYGAETPSGRLPLSIPRDEADLPPFDPVSLEVTYDRWHGYTHLDRRGTEAHFPFGFGLSTTTFAWGTPTLNGTLEDERLEVSVEIENTGTRTGIETVQVYVGREDSDVVRELRGFAQVRLDPGARATVTVPVQVADLRSREDGAWTLRSGTWIIEAGRHVADLDVAGTLQAR